MSTPDRQQHPGRTRNTERYQGIDQGRDEGPNQGVPPDVNRPDEVDEIPRIGLPTEDVELDDRPRR